jgi:hypothetical protein
MTIQWSNNASGELASSISSSATTIVLASGQGVEFPTPGGGNYFYATLTDSSNNLEIIKVTARTTDTLTVLRGQDNTTARSYAAGDLLELRPTAAAFTEMQTYTPSGNLVATTIVSAITELDSEKAGVSLDNTFAGDNTFTKPIIGSVTGSASSATDAVNATNATKITNSGGWNIIPTGTTLYFSYNGTDVATLSSSGDLTVIGNVTAYGSV